MGARHWTEAEDEMLLSLAGEFDPHYIARQLGRSVIACRDRMSKVHRRSSLANSGHMTALECAREYNTNERRVLRLIEQGHLKATRMKRPNLPKPKRAPFWRIDPADAEAVRHLLTAPKRTWK